MIKLLYPQFWQERNIIAYLLLPISLIYQFLSYLRASLAYPVILPAQVICVGNCSVGGTGKTQIVIYLAKLLKAKNVPFVIITKAYGSYIKSTTIIQKGHTALEVGDEGIMLARYGTVIAAKYVKDILPLINELKPDVIIVDDFLQNPYLHKDFTIVSVDSQRLFGNRFLIPAGPLRQNPKQVLDAADLIFLVSSNQDQIPNELTPYIDKLINAQIVPSNNIDKNKNYFAFSGIGNPQRFFLTLENYRLNIVGYKIFPDHYNYLQADLENLYSLAKEHNAILITTRKDYVKFNYLNDEIICLDVELSINNPDLLNEKIFKKAKILN
ncbi:tetraacyldisaccharide 4'-kinase [Rickettsia prowazekii str. GvV257]|uniref:tetraacyldisaccharide 4'-kinase n=1 Tax=Rickettsia prowazekii TaxID=782 RepID=UPI000256BEE0|nr:tetraacyldisaccharide 4'-kinase [Rickettsia prowazekii]AFE52306.1 tetraacyldisaccharide 4'-kinase [Rickettsia prowazekii str. GvV257]AFE53709.1 tetraacyldisaccharide 4'-kinase [Rickettsia prowazekii str. RpGvF24]EOB09253.1 DNA ligase [Rickettsia prowazekii str. GvF12]